MLRSTNTYVAPDIARETDTWFVFKGLWEALALIFIILIIVVGWAVVRIVVLDLAGTIAIYWTEINSSASR